MASKPNDRFLITYISFFLQGNAMLLPYNVFLTAAEYFALRFTGSIYVANFFNYFTFAFIAGNLAFVTLAMTRQHHAHFEQQVYIASVVNIVVFVLLFVSTLLNDDAISPDVYFYLSLVLLITTSATTSFLQNAVFAISAQFPEKYMQSFFSGQGVAGVLTSIVPLVIALSVPADVANTPESVKSRAGGYFIGCAAFSVLSLAMFAAMQRSSVFRFYHRLTREEAHADMTLNETMDENGSTILQEATGKSNTLEPLTWSGFVRVMKRIKLHAFSVAFCFLVTTAFFPAITASVRSVGSADASRFSDPVVFLLIHFLFFNVMDWVSRYIPMLHPRLNISKPSALFWFAIGRLVFVPLLLLSNVDGPVDGSARPIPSALANDAAYLVILSLFAITDGWLATCCLITAPTRMKGEEARVGMAMSFIYTIGLVLGSIVSFGIRGALCECNPFIA